MDNVMEKEEVKKPVDYRDQEKPFEPEERHKKLVSYLNSYKDEYFESEGFKEYKRECDSMNRLVDQRIDKSKTQTKYNFKLALFRSMYDNYADSFDDILSVDEYAVVTSKHYGTDMEVIAKDLELFTNNVLNSISYGSHIRKVNRYLPIYGWAPTFTEFVYSTGYVTKPIADSKAPGGIMWTREMGDILNEPKVSIIHPLNWFGDPDCPVDEQRLSGFIKRWHIEDVVAAMEKVDFEGNPLYNLKALEEMKKKLINKQSSQDENYHSENTESKIHGTEFKKSSKNVSNAIDVGYYFGYINGCDEYLGDTNIYLVECTKELVLRITEVPTDEKLIQINHWQTHKRLDCPFPRSFLSAVTAHANIQDFMLNMGIESMVDDMVENIIVHEDDYDNPEVIAQPPGLKNILWLSDRNEFFEPRVMQKGNGKDYNAMEKVSTIVDLDRQRSSMSDQEAGLIGGKNSTKTATESENLMTAASKKIRAAATRVVNDAMIPEIKQITLLAMQHYNEKQLTFMDPKANDGEGESRRITAAHVMSFLTGTVFDVSDSIIRDRFAEATRKLEYFKLLGQFTNGLQQPQYSVKWLRHLGRELNVKNIDEFLPDVSIPEQPQPQDSNAQIPPQAIPDPQAPQGVLPDPGATGNPQQGY